ncbi:MAG TPA: type II toxin-antitoxin system VapC family toxin [Terriglobales bacterium]|nr:type II toxin-antitoxin system VapC family toxin [Terriglobales bacterium]
MSYLLDTNACIALINGTSVRIRTHLEQAIQKNQEVFVSSIALYELWYGVYKSAREEFNRKRIQTFLSGPMSTLPFEDEDAKFAGSIRAVLERSGKPIGAYDILIAGQAVRHKLTLVTANVAEFSRIKNLDWEDWAKP